MSRVYWIINRRKCLVYVGLLTGANVLCLLDYLHAQMSTLCWLINSRKCLVFVGLYTGANVLCYLDY